MKSKQNFLLYMGVGCILTGVVFLLHINKLLPYTFLTEYINVIAGVICAALYVKTKNKVTIFITTFCFANAGMLILGKQLMVSSWGARALFIPGALCLTAYIFRRKSPLLTVGSLLAFWGIFLIIKEPAGISGYHFSIGALMLFSVLAFVLIWIIERQHWPILPIVIFAGMGSYLIADELGLVAKELLLQLGCVILIIIGIVFVIKSLFKEHFDGE